MIGKIILTKKLIIVIVSIFFISNVSFAVDEGTVQSGAAFNFAAAKKKHQVMIVINLFEKRDGR